MGTWDEQRYSFLRVLMPAPRSGASIDLYFDSARGEKVVVKRLPKERSCGDSDLFYATFPDELEDPWQELRVLWRYGQKGPDHVAGVCPCYGVFRDSRQDVLLVLEYMAEGDLFTFANDLCEPGMMREIQVWPFVRSILRIVLSLHQLGVAHGDISLENILRAPGLLGEVAVVDFAMSQTCCLSKVVGVRGKPSYQAPEMHISTCYDLRSADLFSCGVAAYALAFGGYPWKSTRPGVCNAFQYATTHGLQAFLEKRGIRHGNGAPKKVAECMSPNLKKLLLVLLDFEPSRRHAIIDMFGGAFFGSYINSPNGSLKSN